MNPRIITLIISIGLAAAAFFGLANFYPDAALKYLILSFLAIFFFGILVSNQQYEEDIISKAERVISTFLFSYIVFFLLMFAPLYSFFFNSLVQGNYFLADILRLFLFLFFGILFIIIFFILNSFSRFGFLGHWKIFNSPTWFFVLRSLFITSLCVFYIIHLKPLIYA